jgi:hypothetical protein
MCRGLFLHISTSPHCAGFENATTWLGVRTVASSGVLISLFERVQHVEPRVFRDGDDFLSTHSSTLRTLASKVFGILLKRPSALFCARFCHSRMSSLNTSRIAVGQEIRDSCHRHQLPERETSTQVDEERKCTSGRVGCSRKQQE